MATGAIRGNPGQSVAIRGNQVQSGALRGCSHQLQSVAIRGDQVAIRGAIRGRAYGVRLAKVLHELAGCLVRHEHVRGRPSPVPQPLGGLTQPSRAREQLRVLEHLMREALSGTRWQSGALSVLRYLRPERAGAH